MTLVLFPVIESELSVSETERLVNVIGLVLLEIETPSVIVGTENELRLIGLPDEIERLPIVSNAGKSSMVSVSVELIELKLSDPTSSSCANV